MELGSNLRQELIQRNNSCIQADLEMGLYKSLNDDFKSSLKEELFYPIIGSLGKFNLLTSNLSRYSDEW